MDDIVYLPPTKPTSNAIAEKDNLLTQYGLQELLQKFQENPPSETFIPYISHLPGNLKKAAKPDKDFGLKKLLENAKNEDLAYIPFDETQLKTIFHLEPQIGPLIPVII
jgi:hypothetical protein